MLYAVRSMESENAIASKEDVRTRGTRSSETRPRLGIYIEAAEIHNADSSLSLNRLDTLRLLENFTLPPQWPVTSGPGLIGASRRWQADIVTACCRPETSVSAPTRHKRGEH